MNKIMTIEEKAKAYDELKVKAQELEEDGCFDKITLFDLFPELKESEDERIRNRIIHALHGDVLEMSEIKEAVAWLEKQGEQKPAWSEDDERKKNKLIWIFEEIKKGANYFYGSDVKEIIDWLKSLKHQTTWKPSEEQMKTLEYYAKLPDHSKVLLILYNDLKKLREE